MAMTRLLLLGILVSSILAIPLLPDSSTSSLQLLNVSTPNSDILNTPPYSGTLNARFRRTCFDLALQKPNTTFTDCGNAATRMFANRDLNVPIPFSRSASPSSGFDLPAVSSSGNCVLFINIGSDKDFEILRPQEVMDAALTLAVYCVGRSGPGGKATFGKLDFIVGAQRPTD